MKILIVEDEFLIRLTLAEALSDEGFVIVEAEDGESGLELLRADPSIVLLLTDLQLPGQLDGRGLADAARVFRPDLPVIFTSGRPDARTSGHHELFIPKPYLPSDIISAARRMVTVP